MFIKNSTISRFLRVSRCYDRREQLRGGDRHILCRRSVPHGLDLYQDTVARFQTPRRARRSISTSFRSMQIAPRVFRPLRWRDQRQARGHSRRGVIGAE